MMRNPEQTIITTTYPDKDSAKHTAKLLVERNLAACVQILPIESLYSWQGQICDENEVKLLIKSRSELFDEIAEVIKENHTYEVPEIVQIPITGGSAAYLGWIGECTGERNNVVEHHKQAVRRKSRITGISIASVMSIPILVCFIVNLATAHALDWFFIVLTALMTFASLTVIPLVFGKEKLLWALGSFTASLTLLLATCAIYSGGDWFFVAIISVIFGLSLIFAPFVIGKTKVAPKLLPKLRHKGLLAMTIDTVLLYAVVVVSMNYAQSGGVGEALLSTTTGAVFPWVLFLVIRYLKTSAFTRAGICTIFGGVYSLFMNDIIPLIINVDANANTSLTQVFNANFSDWSSNANVNANIAALILLSSCAVGIALIVVGLLRKEKAKCRICS